MKTHASFSEVATEAPKWVSEVARGASGGVKYASLFGASLTEVAPGAPRGVSEVAKGVLGGLKYAVIVSMSHY